MQIWLHQWWSGDVGFSQGLSKAGYVETHKVKVETVGGLRACDDPQPIPPRDFLSN